MPLTLSAKSIDSLKLKEVLRFPQSFFRASQTSECVGKMSHAKRCDPLLYTVKPLPNDQIGDRRKWAVVGRWPF